MPYPKEATVKIYNGIDCWRTWFLKECESSHLFGVTTKYLPLINTVGFKPYRIGTRIFLEDAPYFKKTKRHRICGPYRIVESNPKDAYEIIRKEIRQIVIYRDDNPSRGPWFDRSSVTRTIEGVKFRHKQLASEFDFFPFRFSIQRDQHYEIFSLPHSSFQCELCYQD